MRKTLTALLPVLPPSRKREGDWIGKILALLLGLVAGGTALAQPAPVEPIDDLQRLFIEDTVALIHPPTTEAGARASALMEQAGAARARGDNGTMRRLLAEARVVLAGGAWTADAAYLASLALRPQRIVLDPAAPLSVEVGQRLAAAVPGEKLTFAAGLRPRRSAPAPSAPIEWRGRVQPVHGDLIDAPVRLRLALDGIADGSYDLVLRVDQGGRVLGDTALGVFVAKDLDRDLAAIARRSAGLRVSPALAASLAWPGDLARTLDDRTRQVVDVAWRPLLDRTLALLTEAEAGRDPLARSSGDRERHYASKLTGRIEPYRLFVPPAWNGKSPLPLVVLLHGSNGDHNRPLASGKAVALAERHGWALLSPMGYAPNGGWGNHLPVVLANGTMPAPRPSTIAGVVLPRDGVTPEPAEADVLDALAAVRAEYPIDGRRIYLAGNSMGGEGVWHLGQRHPRLWAAVAPGAGAIAPRDYPYGRLGKLPVLGVHGDKDEIISFPATAEMIDRLNRAGGRGELLAVPGGGHSAFNDVLDEVFGFFARHARRTDGVPGPLD